MPGRAMLGGVRVLDFTTFLSGPFCTQILGDLGADVLKVEPLGGDSSRQIPPHFVGDDSAYYLSSNRNKRSLAIDLKTPDGLAVIRRLVARSDVVIENFRPGVLSRLGLDPHATREEFPALIWASISGFGQTGVRRDEPAYDMVVQALSGVMSLTGEAGGPPMRLGIPAGDLVAGLYATIAIAAALHARDRDGRGTMLDVSMLDSQLSMLSYQAAYASVSGQAPPRQGSGHDSIPTYRLFRGGDGGEFVITANTERMWTSLCATIGLPELVRDPRFVDASARLEHQEELWAILEEGFAARPAAEWIDRLVAAGVPAAPVRTVPEALADARMSGRDIIVDLADAAGHGLTVVGNPIVAEDWLTPAGYPPALGQDGAAVLADAGYSDDEIAAFRASGVVRT